MEETGKMAHKLGERVGTELGIPIYHYEAAAKEEKRKNLASCVLVNMKDFLKS